MEKGSWDSIHHNATTCMPNIGWPHIKETKNETNFKQEQIIGNRNAHASKTCFLWQQSNRNLVETSFREIDPALLLVLVSEQHSIIKDNRELNLSFVVVVERYEILYNQFGQLFKQKFQRKNFIWSGWENPWNR